MSWGVVVPRKHDEVAQCAHAPQHPQERHDPNDDVIEHPLRAPQLVSPHLHPEGVKGLWLRCQAAPQAPPSTGHAGESAALFARPQAHLQPQRAWDRVTEGREAKGPQEPHDGPKEPAHGVLVPGRQQATCRPRRAHATGMVPKMECALSSTPSCCSCLQVRGSRLLGKTRLRAGGAAEFLEAPTGSMQGRRAHGMRMATPAVSST